MRNCEQIKGGTKMNYKKAYNIVKNLREKNKNNKDIYNALGIILNKSGSKDSKTYLKEVLEFDEFSNNILSHQIENIACVIDFTKKTIVLKQGFLKKIKISFESAREYSFIFRGLINEVYKNN